MTKSEFIRKKIEPLIEVLRPFMNPEDDPKTFEIKIEIWALRLILDIDSCTYNDDDEEATT